MPFADPDPDDPHVLVGVALPGDRDAVRGMATAFADEFAQMGFSRERILGLFRSPFYAGAHSALRALGEEEVGRIVEESVSVLGARRAVVVPGGEAAARCGRRRD